jgi:hypothetical protein
MKKLFVVAILGAVALSFVNEALADQNPMAQLAIDMQIPPTKGSRSCTPTYASCSAIQQVRPTGGGGASARYHAIVVLYRISALGVRGAEYGLCYEGYGYGFTNCADFIIGGTDPLHTGHMDVAQTYGAPKLGPNPDPGTGGLTLGWLDLYASGPVRICFCNTELHGWPSVLGANFLTDLVHTMHCGFGQGALPGPADLDPCAIGPTATENTTWSGVKALYR